MRALLFLVLAGCTEFDIVVEAASEQGTVYECQLPDKQVELCFYDDAADELAWHIGAASCGTTSRWWPELTNTLGLGCNYHCPHYGPGCNAKQGCYCPGGKAP